MATGVLRPGAVLTLVLLLAGPVTGCGAAESTRQGGAARTGSAPAPRTTPPQELCARIVGHWSREVLGDDTDGDDTHGYDTYGDYQAMGLSNGQYGILREVVDAARAERRRGGARAADALIERRTSAGCAELYRTGTPAAGPWQ